MLGQQSLAAIRGCQLDVKRVYEHNKQKWEAAGGEGIVMVKSGDKRSREELSEERAAFEKHFQMTEEDLEFLSFDHTPQFSSSEQILENLILQLEPKRQFHQDWFRAAER